MAAKVAIGNAEKQPLEEFHSWTVFQYSRSRKYTLSQSIQGLTHLDESSHRTWLPLQNAEIRPLEEFLVEP